MGTEAEPVARDKPGLDENGPDRSPRRWWALAVIAIAQLMVVFGSRAVQGLFAAILAPAVLSLITVTFVEARERAAPD